MSNNNNNDTKAGEIIRQYEDVSWNRGPPGTLMVTSHHFYLHEDATTATNNDRVAWQSVSNHTLVPSNNQEEDAFLSVPLYNGDIIELRLRSNNENNSSGHTTIKDLNDEFHRRTHQQALLHQRSNELQDITTTTTVPESFSRDGMKHLETSNGRDHPTAIDKEQHHEIDKEHETTNVEKTGVNQNIPEQEQSHKILLSSHQQPEEEILFYNNLTEGSNHNGRRLSTSSHHSTSLSFLPYHSHHSSSSLPYQPHQQQLNRVPSVASLTDPNPYNPRSPHNPRKISVKFSNVDRHDLQQQLMSILPMNHNNNDDGDDDDVDSEEGENFHSENGSDIKEDSHGHEGDDGDHPTTRKPDRATSRSASSTIPPLPFPLSTTRPHLPLNNHSNTLSSKKNADDDDHNDNETEPLLRVQHENRQLKARVHDLEQQFQQLRQQLLLGAAKINSNANAAASNIAPKIHHGQQEGDEINDEMEMEMVALGHDTTINGDQRQQAHLPHHIIESALHDVVSNDDDEEETDKHHIHDMEDGEADARAMQRRKRRRKTTVMSIVSEEGMDEIRRKLDLRKSTVTGQRLFAKTLPSDTYGFLIVAPVWSVPFVMSLLVFAIQMATYILMRESILEEAVYDNYLGVPPNVDPGVRVVQFVAIIVAVVTQDDLMKGLDLIRVRHSKSFFELFPHTYQWKLYLSVLARCLQGCLGLVTSFLLIVSSETIYFLLLNFTALEFVSHLDEFFFVLSHYGFAGRQCQVAAKAMEDTTFYVHTKVYRHLKILLFVTILMAMIGFWSFIVNQQINGHYLCQTLMVQFGDDMRPELAAFSGMYDQLEDSGGSYVSYIDRHSGTAIFSHCNKGNFWTFRHMHELSEEAYDHLVNGDPCFDWIVRSSETDNYDLVFVGEHNWFVRDELGREVYLDPFVLVCTDCGSHNTCNGRGYCSAGVCNCTEGFFGLQCQFLEPCSRLSLDSRFETFRGTRQWATTYHTFMFDGQIATGYHKPVYFNELHDGSYDLLFYTGRRWGIGYSEDATLLLTNTIEKMANVTSSPTYLNIVNHAYWSNYTVAFVSDPVDLFTPGHAATPEGIKWYVANDWKPGMKVQTPDLIRPVEARFICGLCGNHTNPCMHDGTCNYDQTCECLLGADGVLCEVPPLGNGKCDGFLNSGEYDFDGGDCCESTCQSTAQFSCGRESSRYGYIGYDCALPPDLWQQMASATGDFSDATNTQFNVALSRLGTFLAVAAPAVSKVLIFDRDGRDWIQRGPGIIGPADTGFGRSIRIASGLVDMWNTPRFMVPYTIAIGDSNRRVTVYKCGQERQNTCNDVVQTFSGYTAFDIADNGNVIVLGEDRNDFVRPKVFLVDLKIESSERNNSQAAMKEIDVFFPTTPNEDNIVISFGVRTLSISHDGQTIAVQTNAWDNDYDVMKQFVAYSIVDVDKNQIRVLEELERDLFGGKRPVVISGDGQVAAIASGNCTKGVVTFFSLNRVTGVQLPPLTTPFPDSCESIFDQVSISLDLSFDGKTVALGMGGLAAVHYFNGTSWERVGGLLPEGPTRTFSEAYIEVALSSGDGSVLAIGTAEAYSLFSGTVSIFTTHQRKSPCHSEETLVHLSVVTDDSPKLLSWTLESNITKELIKEMNPSSYVHEFATHVHEICVLADSCSILTIYDGLMSGHGDAEQLVPPGRIDLQADENMVYGGGFKSMARRDFIGNGCLACSDGDSLFRIMLRTCDHVGWQLLDDEGNILVENEQNSIVDISNGVDSVQYGTENTTAYGNNDMTTGYGNGTFPFTNLTQVVANATEGSSDQQFGDGSYDFFSRNVTCARQVYWDELCLDLSRCYTFSSIVYEVKKDPLADTVFAEFENTEEDFWFGLGPLYTEYYLFLGNDEIFRKRHAFIGNHTYFLGNCSQTNG